MADAKSLTALRSALDEISEALLAASFRGTTSNAPFPRGPSGLALAHASLDPVRPHRGHAARAATELTRAGRALAKGSVPPWLLGGFTGVAWLAEYFSPQALDDPSGAIDDALEELLAVDRWDDTYDLVTGLVGYGVYALERLPRPSAARIAARVVAHLAAGAEKQRRGVAWRSRAEWRLGASVLPGGFDLGVAHGVAGVIALLGRAWRAGIERATAGRLLDGAVPWLLAQELPASNPSAFPASVREGTRPVLAGTAWCYGDPGVAAALLVAARATGERAWERAAIRIGARAAARDPRTTFVADLGLCHGAAGLAHVFDRLHVETGDRRFARAARGWVARALAMRLPGAGLARYHVHATAKPSRAEWRLNDTSILTGTAGVAAALAACASKKGAGWASWDRVLLLSGDPRAPDDVAQRSNRRIRA